MTNRLATHLTTWKWWYALFVFPALLASSTVAILAGMFPGANDSSLSTAAGLMVPVQFIVLAVVALGLVALAARSWPSRRDLGLTKRLTRSDLVIIAVAFVVSHLIFWLLGRTEAPDPGQAERYFNDTGLGGPLLPAIAALVASTILAPVCEELVYRGTVLRPLHDWLARRGSTHVAAAVSILVSAILFAMPHLGGSLVGAQSLSYLATGIAFGLVYVLTGSMTAVMVSHSLQSAVAFGQILVLGHGGHSVHPVLYVIAFGCPLWVYLCARALSPKTGS